MEEDTASENPFSRRDVLHLSTATLGGYGFSKTVAAQSENTVRGTVVETDGDPIEGANVRVPLSDGDIQTTTNAAGVFEIEFGDRTVPDTVTVIISAVGYATESVNVSTSGDEVTVQLLRGDEDRVVISEEIHHLGDGRYSGSINSQFQEEVEGDEFETTFSLTDLQASSEQAELVYSIRGAQLDNEIRINGQTVAVTDISSEDGSASRSITNFDPSVLQSGTNNFKIISTINPINSNDIDDFEISNIRINLSNYNKESFDPDIHAFDFNNWSVVGPDEEAAFDPAHNHRNISLNEVKTIIEQEWKTELEEYNITTLGPQSALALLLYVNNNQGSATRGHCFGMVFTAQEYFEQPDNIPVDVSSVDEIPRPTGEYSSVGDRIDFYQNTAYLNFDTYTRGEIILKNRSTDINYDNNLEKIKNSIDDAGTAPIGLSQYIPAPSDEPSKWKAHQVLAYDYTEDTEVTSIDVYDPNSTDIEPEKFAITAGSEVTFRWEGGPYAISINSFFDVDDNQTNFTEGQVIRSQTLTETVSFETPGAYFVSATPYPKQPCTIRVVESRESLREDFEGIDFTDESEVAVAVGSGPTPSIEFDTSGSDTTLITNSSGNVYRGYDRLVYLGGDDVNLSGYVAGSIADLLTDSLSGVASIATKSPISLNVKDPNGDSLVTASSDFASDNITEYDNIWYRYNAPAGEYDIEVIGTDDGEYTVESRVQTSNGGFINDSFTDTILEGESKTLTATVPEQEGEEGSIFALAEFDQDDDGQIGFDDLRYAGREYNRGNITFDQLRRIARAYNTGESV